MKGQTKLLKADEPEHIEYVRKMDEIESLYLRRSEGVWSDMMDYWDLYLAEQDDPRDPVDEQWRSKIFVPLPSSGTITKASQMTQILTGADPIWQVRGSRDDETILKQTKPVERLLDYSMRLNSPRKLFYKLMTSRSVQGTTFCKLTFQQKSHEIYHIPTDSDFEKFAEAVKNSVAGGAPVPPDWQMEAAEFDKWRNDVNLTKMYGKIPSPPREGPKEIVTYRGPVIQQLPAWAVRIDPTIEDMANQPVIMHRVLRPLEWVLSRADNKMDSPKPFLLANVEAAKAASTGDLVTQYEQHLNEVLHIESSDVSDPKYSNYVELLEVWSPDEKFKFAVIMNRQAVINKNPFEFPTTDGRPNIYAIRNLPVEGHFYGLSDYKQPFELFRELNQFRRLRMDGATMNVLPVFAKQAGITLPQNLRSVRPGGIVTLQNVNAIKKLFDTNMPSEAYREPQEIKDEISDATGIYGQTKGKEATVGRVTGTEFQGRNAQVQMRFSVDCGIVEDDLQWLPNGILSLWHQMADGPVRVRISGGDPMIEMGKEEIQDFLNESFVFRGPTRAEDPNMLVQQMTNIIPRFQDILTPPERRKAMGVMLEALDIKGMSSIIGEEAQAQAQAMAAQQAQAAAAQAQTQTTQAQAANQQVAPTIPAGEAPPMG